tara:strand:+ start:858 stop:2432 length:1575 start_codon:yes stop_codon:yes gene_type:complete
MDLIQWSWLFLAIYIAGMVLFGFIGRRRIKGADDFATARGSYGPIFLAFAFAATTASGATFVGFPGIAYEAGFAAIWSVFLYPIGVYLGVLVCLRVVSRGGEVFGSRSIPEYLGTRYQSDWVRVLVSVFSLLLFFYLAGQLVSGIVMFEIMLGVTPSMALGVTAAILIVYVVLGGAHADILTDGVQGFIMVIIAVGVLAMFLVGFSIDGGLSGLSSNLKSQDPNLVGWLNTNDVRYHSWWSVIAILLAHIPLGMLPHIGNKLWALKEPRQRRRFLTLAFTFGLILGMLGLGGLLARAILGDTLLQPDMGSNMALSMLFVELFPSWLAALLGIGILAAVMSTADGLVVSSSQILANDLYRCTYVPLFSSGLSEDQVDKNVLRISRIGTVVIMILCTMMAWLLMDTNVALIVWIGTGGMMAAFAGPLVMGSIWRGVTTSGAVAGLISGVTVFSITHAAIISPDWFSSPLLKGIAEWLQTEAPNPWSCAAMGEIASILFTWLVSLASKPIPAEHLDKMFGSTEYENS